MSKQSSLAIEEVEDLVLDLGADDGMEPTLSVINARRHSRYSFLDVSNSANDAITFGGTITVSF